MSPLKNLNYYMRPRVIYETPIYYIVLGLKGEHQLTVFSS